MRAGLVVRKSSLDGGKPIWLGIFSILHNTNYAV